MPAKSMVIVCVNKRTAIVLGKLVSRFYDVEYGLV